MEKNNRFEITKGDIVEANLHLINAFVMEASMTLDDEKKVKSLAMAYLKIEKTLSLLGLDTSQLTGQV